MSHREDLEVLGFSVAKIWTDSDWLTTELSWHSCVFTLLTKGKIGKNPVPYEHYKSHEHQLS